MKFKVGDRVAAYDRDERVTGIMIKVNNTANTILIDFDDNFRWFHEKQCRKLVKKKPKSECYMYGKEVRDMMKELKYCECKDSVIVVSYIDEHRQECMKCKLQIEAFKRTPKPLKLEVGKLYKTMNGKKAFISSEEIDDISLFVGMIQGNNYKTYWNKNGSDMLSNIDDKKNNKIISEWED